MDTQNAPWTKLVNTIIFMVVCMPVFMNASTYVNEFYFDWVKSQRELPKYQIVGGGQLPMNKLYSVRPGMFVEDIGPATEAKQSQFAGKWTVLLVGSGGTIHGVKSAKQRSIFMQKLRKMAPEVQSGSVQLRRQLAAAAFQTMGFNSKCDLINCTDMWLFAGETGWFGGSEVHFEPGRRWLAELTLGSLGLKKVPKATPLMVVVRPDLSVIGFTDPNGNPITLHPEILAAALKLMMKEA